MRSNDHLCKNWLRRIVLSITRWIDNLVFRKSGIQKFACRSTTDSLFSSIREMRHLRRNLPFPQSLRPENHRSRIGVTFEKP